MELALIPPGSYLQGSPPDEPERRSDEGPQRLVTITEPFYLGIAAVTQAEYEKVMHETPAYLRQSNHPVEAVSWDEAMAFCGRLADLRDEFFARRTYRMPPEAEWEYVCRAGTSTAYGLGELLDATLCNFDGNYPLPGAALGPYRRQTCPAISFLANAFGLYQMHGNVWEWCSDWYDAEAYRAEAIDPQRSLPLRLSEAQVSLRIHSPQQIEPQSEQRGWERVLRGGSWVSDGRECRSAQRGRMPPNMRDDDVGFRVVMECLALP
jgi:formylglycine-generating enzyme required for sulfatase activity